LLNRDIMPDLTLNEYRGLSEHELRRVLKEEALKMFGADALMQKKVVVPLSDNSRKGTGSDRRKGKESLSAIRLQH
jgi:hypothetical protein